MSAKNQPIGEERAHAILSASSAKRWLACTPSARFEERYPESTSTYAEEGTAAHALAAATLENHAADIAKAKASPYYNAQMQEHIDSYVRYVEERFNAALAQTPDARLFIEQRLDYSAWVPEGFGTGDVIIIGNGALEIIDLKYGAGVPVQAQENPQLKLYGAGAWAAFDMLFDIHQVQTTIFQPRLDSVTTNVIPVPELLDWLENEVKPRAERAWEGTGQFTPGEHCHFCRALPHCRALAEHNLRLTQYAFRAQNELTDEEIAEILGSSELLTKWAGKMYAYALEQVVSHGKRFPGWKLVEGRSNRKYADQLKVAERLKAAGFDDALIYTHDLLGITAMEEVVGKKKLAELLDGLITKAPGAPKLAPDGDKRAELGSTQGAREDFAAEPQEGTPND